MLVSAASAHGGTAEIARVISDGLIHQGLDATLIAPAEVAEVTDYDAVIVGSAVYMGHWLEPAKDLVERFRDAHSTRPVWLFSSGPVGDPAGKLARAMNQDPVDLAAVRDATRARGHQIFAGKLDPKGLSRAQQASLLVFRGLKGDFRDRDAIRSWADSIAAQLTESWSGKPRR